MLWYDSKITNEFICTFKSKKQIRWLWYSIVDLIAIRSKIASLNIRVICFSLLCVHISLLSASTIRLTVDLYNVHCTQKRANFIARTCSVHCLKIHSCIFTTLIFFHSKWAIDLNHLLLLFFSFFLISLFQMNSKHIQTLFYLYICCRWYAMQRHTLHNANFQRLASFSLGPMFNVDANFSFFSNKKLKINSTTSINWKLFYITDEWMHFYVQFVYYCLLAVYLWDTQRNKITRYIMYQLYVGMTFQIRIIQIELFGGTILDVCIIFILLSTIHMLIVKIISYPSMIMIKVSLTILLQFRCVFDRVEWIEDIVKNLWNIQCLFIDFPSHLHTIMEAFEMNLPD